MPFLIDEMALTQPNAVIKSRAKHRYAESRDVTSAPDSLELRVADWFGPSDDIRRGIQAWAATRGIHVHIVHVDRSRKISDAYLTPGSMKTVVHHGQSQTSFGASTIPQIERFFHTTFFSHTLSLADILVQKEEGPKKRRADLCLQTLNNDVQGVGRTWDSLPAHERTSLFLMAAAVGAREVMDFALTRQPGLSHFVDPQPAGNSALHYAALGGHLDCVASLIAKGSAISSKNAVGTPPRFDAARAGHPEILRLLVQGQDLFDTNDYGDTVIHRLAMYGSQSRAESFVAAMHEILSEMRRINLSFDARIRLLNISNNQQFTALDLAVATGQTSLAALLAKEGAEHSQQWKMSPAGAWTWQNVSHAHGAGRASPRAGTSSSTGKAPRNQ